MNITNNEMVNVLTGHYSIGFLNELMKDQNNTIQLEPYPTITPATFGIEIVQGNINIIQGNYILGTPVLPVYTYQPFATGICNVHEIVGSTPIETCNYTGYVQNGFLYNATTGFGNNWWLNNMMDNDYIGMNMAASTEIGVQGNISLASGNQWWGTYAPGIAYETFSGNYPFFSSSGFLSNLYVQAGSGAGYNDVGWNGGSLPSYVFAIGNGITETSAAPGSPCSITSGVIYYSTYMPAVWLSVDSLLDPSVSTTSVAQINWVVQKALYDALQANPTLVDTVYALYEWDSIAQYSRFAWIYNIENDIVNEDYADAQNQLGYNMDAFAIVDTDTVSGMYFMDTTLADVVIANYVNYFNAFLNYVNGQMTADDTATVTYIANLCPAENGSVVFNARSLYFSLYNDIGNFTDVCPDMVQGQGNNSGNNSGNNGGCATCGGNRTMTHKENGKSAISTGNQNYSLYPNPTNGTITLQQTNIDNQPVTITITNLVGQIVYENSVIFAGGMYELQIPSSLQAGMYLMQITSNTNQRFNLNFVLE